MNQQTPTPEQYQQVQDYHTELCNFYGNANAKFEIMNSRRELSKFEPKSPLSKLSWSNFNEVIMFEINKVDEWLKVNRLRVQKIV